MTVRAQAVCTALGVLSLGAGDATGAAQTSITDVLYGGCAAVSTGPVCYLPDDNALTLWFSPPPRSVVTVLVDGVPAAEHHATDAGEGSRHRVTVAPDARELAVVATTADGSARWELALDREPLPGWLTEARKDYRERRLDAAQRRVQSALADREEDRFEGYALGLLGRIARRQDDSATAKTNLENAVTAHLAAGRYSEAFNDASVLAYTWLRNDRNFAAARQSLASTGDFAQAPAESRYYAAYYDGLIELEAGNARAALPGLRSAAHIARAMGWNRLRLSAEQALATQLQNLGRYEDARALLEQWRGALPDDLTPCERANFLTNTGWAALLMLEAGRAAEDPTPVLREALLQNEASCSRLATSNARINLALAHLHAGRPADAQALLQEIAAQEGTPDLRVALWWHDIAGRVALASGDARTALERFNELEGLARLTLSGDAQWRAAVRKALLYAEQRNTTEALRQFAVARALRDDDLLRVPMDEGRNYVLAMRARGFHAQMSLLLNSGLHRDAMRLLRNEHAAELRLLAPVAGERLAAEGFYAQYERSRQHMLSLVDSLWTLPVDELEAAEREIAAQEKALRDRLDVLLSDTAAVRQTKDAPDPPQGQVLVALHQSGDVWWLLTQRGQAATARVLPCSLSKPDAMGRCVLDAVWPETQSAETIAFLVPAALDEVAFHALTVDGQALIDSVGVVYQVETGGPATKETSAPASALLVADPAGRLPAARREAKRLRSELSADGNWALQLLEGRDATLASVRSALSDATLFHFAGHAQHAGPAGWNSHLALARGDTLGVTDILALPAVPPMVVLSGCETGRQVRPHTAASIGLAQAFIARGSHWVVATTRPVDDQAAAVLTTAFYEHWDNGAGVAAAFRSAQQELKTSRPASDWAAFRLLARPLGETL
ncbi:MAG: CHAT domain-containing protein [Pseudomonadota bacterium]